MGVAQGPVVVLSASGDGGVGAESRSGVSENSVHPVVSSETLVEVHVVERTEVGNVIAAQVVPYRSELVLEPDEVLRIHSDDGFLVGHSLEAVVSVELDRDLLAFLGALGRDDDDTVSASATIDRR